MSFGDLTLGYVLDMLRSLLQDRAKDILQRKSSEQKARDLSFRLYEKVREVRNHSGQFVQCMASLLEMLRKEVPSEIRGKKTLRRRRRALRLWRKPTRSIRV